TGYTGKKLIQFCSNHPFVKDFEVYANTTADENLSTLFPDIEGLIEDKKVLSIKSVSFDHDLYFLTLPHGEALNFVPALISKGKKVIDLGGDYRLDFEELYLQWYKLEHSSSYLLKSKVYGLADFYKTEYTDAQLIANPGCYPTAVLLSLLPIVKNFGDDIVSVSCSAYSGTSGAGKSPKSEFLLTEMEGNVKAYNVNTHRHEPEILQTLYKNGFHSPFAFTTHLLPVAVGIYATSFIHLKNNVDEASVQKIYKQVYEESSFVRIRKMPPELKWVINSNFCDINVSVKEKKVVVTTAIDNLVKGAAGQAIQNMNKLYGWDESLGILQKEVKHAALS
ncbi:MAG: N-acetyl-gamma-glutamyl-phosphate reductase, partial [Ignavibacteriaceae bacterium]